MKPTLVILSNVVPTHSSEPGSPRLYALSREWSERYQLVLLIISEKSTPSEVEMHPDVRQLFHEIVPLPKNSNPKLFGRIIHRLLQAPFFMLEYKNRQYVQLVREKIRRALSSYPVYHLHVNYLSNVQFIPPELDASKITVDVRDDPTLLYEREASLESSFIRKRSLLQEGKDHGRYIRRIIRDGYKLVIVGRDDQAHLDKAWGVQTLLCPNGVDSSYFSAAVAKDKSEHSVVFTGVMDYRPNLEAVLYFAENIFPAIRSQQPDAQFLIVGANPSPEVKKLSAQAGITVTGFVPDVRPFLERATVFVCPMLSGAGIKNKILAAMAVGIPVVSTTLGVAGIQVEGGTHFLLADDVDRFAQHILSIFEQPDKYQGMTSEARKFVLQNHSWKVAADTIADYFGGNLS